MRFESIFKKREMNVTFKALEKHLPFIYLSITIVEATIENFTLLEQTQFMKNFACLKGYCFKISVVNVSLLFLLVGHRF